MNIAVCVKQVPDTADLRLDPQTHTLIREGVDAVLNPLDEFPLEAALRLREACGGRVTVLTMGPPQAVAVLRKALAMGADHAVLVTDRKFAGSDTWATSLVLARTLVELGPFDLILCGKQAIDGDTAQVGPGIAAHLGIPQVTYVTRLWTGDGGTFRAERLLDTGTALLEIILPVVLTVLKETNEPRLPTLAGRLRALHAHIRHITAAELGIPDEELGLKGSPTRVVKISIPSLDRKQMVLKTNAQEAASGLLGELRRRHLLPAAE